MSAKPPVWCAVCGRLAQWLDNNRTKCSQGHTVTLWGVEGVEPGYLDENAHWHAQTPDPPPGETWRDREPLL